MVFVDIIEFFAFLEFVEFGQLNEFCLSLMG